MSNTETAVESSGGWVFGLPKVWAACLNVGAILLICVMFWQDRQESLKTAREDRAVFKSAVERLSEASDRQGEAIRTLAVQVQRLGEKLERDRRGAK